MTQSKNLILKNSISETVLSVLFLSCLFFVGCKKEGCTDSNAINYDKDAEKNDGSCQLAGTGGTTIIIAKPEHHGETIYNQPNYRDTAYVKFSSKEFPGSSPSSYDAIFVGKSGEDHVHIGGLKPGYYYIYMVGFDTSIVQRVTGGIPVALTQSMGEVEMVVPVTE